ncbi:hypothetical protein BDV37DRAFT_292122 [Aspergillus pseudonomiae]|uniref:Rhodopsin domain-containing protein n=1 Tax=Aspergillus pseudonomiae TaxID=1506151 RepID=A0A5N7DJG0_9EURO|nr:uncharacterized protein BDV37DRAFT_292122 [Aspergillus pseudonomiae]KAE8406582.1 hypothetical protein BDV37DRAFT_292122 [Aspergillus pseudonomiae]
MGSTAGVIPPPPGVTPDFDYSNPRGFKTEMIIFGIGLFLSTLFLAMRVYTRACLLSKFGWDDVSIIIAWVLSLATQIACMLSCVYGGTGIHLWNVTPAMFDVYQKTILAAAVIYVPALAFAKVGLIILYHRIINKQNTYKWALHIISAIICGYSVAIVFALIFACNPIQRSWDSSITRGSCIDRNGLYIATAVTNIVSDLALIVVPVPLVLGLQMPRVQKLGLLFMFVVGCATFITSILRLTTLIPTLTATDVTYAIADAQLWIYVEANLIIICPCLPFLRQFLRYYSPSWIGEATSSGQRYFGYYGTGSAPRSRRKQGLTLLQDDIALAESTESTHSQSHIIKEVQWQVIEEHGNAESAARVGLSRRV